MLKYIGDSESAAGENVLSVFGGKDDVLADFDFNPIHLCVLNMYGNQHPERPSLEEYV